MLVVVGEGIGGEEMFSGLMEGVEGVVGSSAGCGDRAGG